ncbi:hypothetical protein D3C77_609470 [compost metagenome]
MAWLYAVMLTIGLELETAFYDEDHFVIEHGPGYLCALPSSKANAHVRRHFVANGAGHGRATGWAATVSEVQCPVVDQKYRAVTACWASHTSLLLFHAARRMRVRTPRPRNGSGGLRDGIPVTLWISLSSCELPPTAISASSVPEMVPQAAPTPLSHAVA